MDAARGEVHGACRGSVGEGSGVRGIPIRAGRSTDGNDQETRPDDGVATSHDVDVDVSPFFGPSSKDQSTRDIDGASGNPAGIAGTGKKRPYVLSHSPLPPSTRLTQTALGR